MSIYKQTSLYRFIELHCILDTRNGITAFYDGPKRWRKISGSVLRQQKLLYLRIAEETILRYIQCEDYRVLIPNVSRNIIYVKGPLL